MAQTVNINAFAPAPIKGDLDLQIMESRTISGIISANQATALKAGTPVKLDATITSGFVPQFVAAGRDDVAHGYIKRTVQAASFAAGDKVEVVGEFGPVQWLEAGGTIAPGDRVESTADGSQVVTVSSHKVRGIALDPGTSGSLLRVIEMTPAASAS